METKRVLSDSRRLLLLKFVSLVKGRKFTSLGTMRDDVSATFSIAEKLSNTDLSWLIEQLKLRFGG